LITLRDDANITSAFNSANWYNKKLSYHTDSVGQRSLCSSTSPILLSVKSLYATSNWWIILTYMLPHTISKLLQIIGQISAT